MYLYRVLVAFITHCCFQDVSLPRVLMTCCQKIVLYFFTTSLNCYTNIPAAVIERTTEVVNVKDFTIPKTVVNSTVYCFRNCAMLLHISKIFLKLIL